MENLADFKKSVEGECTHSIKTTYTHDHDDGYGKWWKTSYEKCNICGQKVLGSDKYL